MEVNEEQQRPKLIELPKPEVPKWKRKIFGFYFTLDRELLKYVKRSREGMIAHYEKRTKEIERLKGSGAMKRFTFYYEYKEPQKDSFKCEAETLDEAWKLFDKETEYLDDVEVEFHSEDEIPAAPIEPDPNQLTFDFNKLEPLEHLCP